MFSSSADLYDLIYAGFKDYPAEAAALDRIIRGEVPDARRVLDVGCGTGEHARLLAERHGYAVDGLDLDPDLVRIARRKLPGGRVHEADMCAFDLGERYDVVLCLFSAIGYVRTLENVRRALGRFHAHLAEDGLLLLEPWLAPGQLDPGHVDVRTARAEGLAVARVSRTEVEGRLSRLHFEYLVARPTGIEHASEVHELGLFTPNEMLACFRDAGLAAVLDPEGPSGRGLYRARAA